MILRLGTFDDVRGEEPGIAGKRYPEVTLALWPPLCFRAVIHTSTGTRYGTYGMYVSHMYVSYIRFMYVVVRMTSMYVYGEN